ncbi:MAG: type II toxin-antitoxin system VapC family toxin [Verrucomicrobiota bacterium]|jgi:PIN domain nuclease of toxin-antitoxin system
MMLLDTCVLLWLAADTTAISARAKDLIRNTPEGLFVSAISAFEVGQKAAAGKLSLPRSVDAWFDAMVQWHGLHELPVSGVIAARANLLPAIHRDPFDRLLIATAQEHRLEILTPDTTIAKYPGLDTLW